MLQFKVRALKDDGDDIKPGVKLAVTFLNVGFGSIDQKTNFPVTDCLGRMFIIGACSCFDLDDNQFILINGNDVNFVMIPPPIGLYNLIT